MNRRNLMFALATLVLGWSNSVAGWSGTRLDLWSWPGLEILLVLVPFFAYTLLAIDARVRLLDRRAEQQSDLRRLELRSLLASLLPFAVMIGATSALGLYEPLRVQVVARGTRLAASMAAAPCVEHVAAARGPRARHARGTCEPAGFSLSRARRLAHRLPAVQCGRGRRRTLAYGALFGPAARAARRARA